MNCPFELDQAADVFTDYWNDERPRALAALINSKANSAAVDRFMDSVMDLLDGGDVVRSWMRLALANDAAGLLASVAAFTNNTINDNTEEWVEEQLFTGDWIETERARSAQGE